MLPLLKRYLSFVPSRNWLKVCFEGTIFAEFDVAYRFSLLLQIQIVLQFTKTIVIRFSTDLCFESILVRPGIRNLSARFNPHRIHTPNFKPVKFQIQKCIYSEARCLALVVSCSNIAFFKECAQLLVAKRTFLNPLYQGLPACIL